MNTFFYLFGRRFRKWYRPPAAMKARIEALARSTPTEISCEDVSLVLDHFVKVAEQGENVLLFMPLIRQHLDVCPACRAQYEQLLSTLQPQSD